MEYLIAELLFQHSMGTKTLKNTKVLYVSVCHVPFAIDCIRCFG